MSEVMPPVLRPMSAEADVEALWAVFREIVEEGATYVQDETTTVETFRDYWIGRGGEQWVAVIGGRVAGGYTVRANKVGRGRHVANASYIVDSRARGQGVGRALGAHSLERARALGFRAMQFNFVVSTNDSGDEAVA